jgi:alpha-tubulin suppressor-like RCC1 family protein
MVILSHAILCHVPWSRNLPPRDIVSIACGGQSSAALTVDGYVYTWGNNDDFALGRWVGEDEGHLVKRMDAPTTTDTESPKGFMRNVIQVRMGDSHSLLLTVDGNVYSTGKYKDAVRKRKRMSPPSSPSRRPLFLLGLLYYFRILYCMGFLCRTPRSGGTYHLHKRRYGLISRASRGNNRRQLQKWWRRTDMVMRSNKSTSQQGREVETKPPPLSKNFRARSCGSNVGIAGMLLNWTMEPYGRGESGFPGS